MSKKYYNGDKVLLYVRFFDNNSNIQSVVEEPRVRILHANKGELYEDLEWTPLKKMGEGEYYNKFTIPFDADNGIYNIIYSGILNGEEVKTIEEFHVVRKSEHYSNAIKVYGYIDESYSNKPLDDVNISISSYDKMYYTESNTSFDGKWETYLYPGEYLINFEKEGYELLSTSFELGTDSKEIQFNNITLKSFDLKNNYALNLYSNTFYYFEKSIKNLYFKSVLNYFNIVVIFNFISKIFYTFY